MDKKKIVLTFLFYIFSIFILTEDTKAKSLDKEKFLKHFNKIESFIYKNDFTLKNFNFVKDIKKRFDVDQLAIKNEQKGLFYFFFCNSRDYDGPGEESYYGYTHQQIEYCLKSDKYFVESKFYSSEKSKDNNSIENFVEKIIAFKVGAYSSLKYQNNPSPENLEITKKYNNKLLNYKSSNKNKYFYEQGLKNFSLIYRGQRNYDKAEMMHKLMLNSKKCFSKRSGMSTKQEIKCDEEKTNYGILLMSMENYEKARLILEENINNETKKNFNRENRRGVRDALYYYHLKKMNYDLAEDYMYDSLQFIDTSSGPVSKKNYFEGLANLYDIYKMNGKIEEAKNGYIKLISDIEKEFGKNSIHTKGALAALIGIYSKDITNIKKETELAKKLSEIIEANPKDLLREDFYYATIAGNFHGNGQLEKAELFYSKAYEIQKRSSHLENLIIIKIGLKKFEEAERLLKKFNPQDNHQKFSYLGIKSALYSETNIEKYKNNLIKLYSHISNYSKSVTKNRGEPSVENYNSDIEDFIYRYNSLKKSDSEKVSDYFLNQTGIKIETALIELSEISRSSKLNKRVKNIVNRSKNDKLNNEKRILQDLIISYEKIPLISENNLDKEKNIKKLISIKREINNQQNKILSKIDIQKFSNFGQEISLKNIQKELKSNQLILSYYLTNRQGLYIYCITNNNFEIKKIDITNDKLKNSIKQIKASISVENIRNNKFDLSKSNEIYNILINPIKKNLINKNELIIIPHKSLTSLPFEILVENKNSESTSWLIKNYSTSYYPSIYSFYNLNKIKLKNKKDSFIGFGNPKFSSSKNKKAINYNNIMLRGIANPEEIRNMISLPETEKELKILSKLFKKENSKIYVGKKFSEDKLKSLNLSNYRYIAFATHAIIANQINNISEPGLILTPPKVATEANDGILTVSEIEKLNLQSDVIILSACNTASDDGTPNGEGLSGLASAFFHAGTKSILVTHWDVETNAAINLTTGTFKYLKNSDNLSKALQKAKIEMLSNPDTSHPFYWAPFILIGNLNL
jgi:CHAT domain-containing protein